MTDTAARRSEKAGLPPGTLVHVGEKRLEKTRITVIDYDQEGLREKEARTVEECFPLQDAPTVTWINVDGIHEVEIVEQLGSRLGLHPLIQEDIVNTQQRPKMEDFGTYLFIVLKMPYCDEEGQMQATQVSLVLGPNFVVSFQEWSPDVFEPIRERIRAGKGRLRSMGADYLAYALIDAIVDDYFVLLERLGENIEELEDELVTSPGPQTLKPIHNLKRNMISLRRSVWPLREVVSFLERGETQLIHESTRIYLRDVYDHTIQVIDAIEALRDTAAGMLDVYLSSVSNKMNEIMKVLTIIATLFIPLTFLVGVYGMNFDHMPELRWHYGYAMVWMVMLIVAGAMLAYFRRKRWM